MIIKQLEVVGQLKVPFVHIKQWKHEEGGSDLVTMGDETFFSQIHSPYVAMGSGGVTLVTSIILLGVNLYIMCCSGRARGLRALLQQGRKEEGVLPLQGPQHQLPPPPAYGAAVPMQQRRLLEGHEQVMQYPPVGQSPQVQVTLSPEQMADMMGIARMRMPAPQGQRALRHFDEE